MFHATIKLAGQGATLAMLLAAFPGAALAQDQACPYAPAIVALSDTVIEGREALAKLPARRYGADAAYLEIRYGALGDAEAEALIQSLIDAGARGTEELGLTLAISEGGVEAALDGWSALVGAEPRL